MKILDKEIDFNLTDLDNMEKIENAMKTVQKKSLENKETGIKKLRIESEIVKNCFDEIFGAENNIIAKNNDYAVIMKAFEELSIAFLNAQIETTSMMKKGLNNVKKYSVDRIKR